MVRFVRVLVLLVVTFVLVVAPATSASAGPKDQQRTEITVEKGKMFVPGAAHQVAPPASASGEGFITYAQYFNFLLLFFWLYGYYGKT